MSQHLETVRNIITSWDARDFDTFLDFLTDDIEYHSHVGSPPYRGKQAIRDFLEQYDTDNVDVEWRLLNHAENGDLFMVEGRVDQNNSETGEQVIHRYMGIFEFRDGKVYGWRDYFQKDLQE